MSTRTMSGLVAAGLVGALIACSSDEGPVGGAVSGPPGNRQPATGANVDAEVFLNDTHPAPNSGQATTEKAGGVYDVGPIRFDAAGRWTVRFHVHEDCQDSTEDSPHGHVAFYIDVP